jgi:hypothetical protein
MIISEMDTTALKFTILHTKETALQTAINAVEMAIINSSQDVENVLQTAVEAYNGVCDLENYFRSLGFNTNLPGEKNLERITGEELYRKLSPEMQQKYDSLKI